MRIRLLNIEIDFVVIKLSLMSTIIMIASWRVFAQSLSKQRGEASCTDYVNFWWSVYTRQGKKK